MAEAIEEADQGGVNQTLKDLFSGAVGGVAQVLIGMNITRLFHSFTQSLGILCDFVGNREVFY